MNIHKDAEFNTVLNALSKPASNNIFNQIIKTETLIQNEYYFYKLARISLSEEQNSRHSLENVFSTISGLGVNGVYALKGDEQGVTLYFGLVRDFNQATSAMSVENAAEMILKPSFEGNFIGSELEELHDSSEVVDALSRFKQVGILQGAVGDQEEGELLNHQGVDAIVNIMMGKPFMLTITFSGINHTDADNIESGLHEAFKQLSLLARSSLQVGNNQSKNETSSINNSESEGANYSKGVNEGSSDATTTTTTTKIDDDLSEAGSEAHTDNEGKSETWGYNKNKTEGDSKSNSSTKGDSQTINLDILNPQAQKWANYIENVLLPRVDYGRSRGLFITNISLFAETHPALLTLGNSCKAIFSGNKNNCYPLQFSSISEYENAVRCVRQLQIPTMSISRNQVISPKHRMNHFLKSRCIGDHSKLMLGTFYSTRELSLIAGLPQNEVSGISIEPNITFGLNPPNIKKEDQLTLGNLVKSGRVCQGNYVALSKKELNKHVFVAGATGNGKTTTCKYLLKESELPFLVIEPAKTEYREMISEYDDLLIFTLGREDLAPMRLNPLALLPNESISNRVDTVKAAFMASFEMEAAIPQIFEAALYSCYEKKNWNLTFSKYMGKNKNNDNSIYPTLSDLTAQIEKEVEQQNFDERLKKDYIASINSRLQGLMVGAKGAMLNSSSSIDFDSLLDRRVVIELEEIRNNQEKSLLMGFVITNLIQAIKNRHEKDKKFRHLTLIEEAHRLLSNPGLAASQNEKMGVEIFSDMLAEVRKYGEGLVIVDQIPSKLMPEVIKSTNTKIIHKLIAKDDKEAVGNGMALNEQQQNYLSQLDVGHAVVFSQGWRQSVQVKITEPDTVVIPDRKLVISEIKKRYAKFTYDEIKSQHGIGYSFSVWQKLHSSNILGYYENLISDFDNMRIIENFEGKVGDLKGKEIDTHWLAHFIACNVYAENGVEETMLYKEQIINMLSALKNKHDFVLTEFNLDTKNRRKVICSD